MGGPANPSDKPKAPARKSRYSQPNAAIAPPAANLELPNGITALENTSRQRTSHDQSQETIVGKPIFALASSQTTSPATPLTPAKDTRETWTIENDQRSSRFDTASDDDNLPTIDPPDVPSQVDDNPPLIAPKEFELTPLIDASNLTTGPTNSDDAPSRELNTRLLPPSYEIASAYDKTPAYDSPPAHDQSPLSDSPQHNDQSPTELTSEAMEEFLASHQGPDVDDHHSVARIQFPAHKINRTTDHTLSASRVNSDHGISSSPQARIQLADVNQSNISSIEQKRDRLDARQPEILESNQSVRNSTLSQETTSEFTIEADESLNQRETPQADQADAKTKSNEEPSPTDATTDETFPRALHSPKSQVVAESAELKSNEIVGWPMPTSLLKDLDELTQMPHTEQWARAAYTALFDLNQLELDDPEAQPILEYCHQLSEQLAKYAADLVRSNPDFVDSANHLSRIAYRLRRRIDIWNIVHHLAKRELENDQPQTTENAIVQLVAERKTDFSTSELTPDWQEYLMLDQAEKVFNDDKASVARRRSVSRKILSRIHSVAITEQQRDYAQESIGQPLIDSLRAEATGPLDFGTFLEHLEEFESESKAETDFRFNDHFQTFYWHEDPEVRRLANAINDHYRNANFRVQVTEGFINLLLPKTLNYYEPVSETILGARVFGQSRIQNQLQVALVPDKEHLRFRFQTLGSVFSRTRAHHSGFVFHNLGNASVKRVEKHCHRPSRHISVADERLGVIESTFAGCSFADGWCAISRFLGAANRAESTVDKRTAGESDGRAETQNRVPVASRQRDSAAHCRSAKVVQ